MTKRLVLLALILAAGPAVAQPKVDPAWPCVQRKVPTIAAGAIWSGPDPASVGEWGSDFEAAALAQRLASRRTDLGQADALLDEFAAKAGPEKAERLTRVFVGVLELINTERDRILQGIERYARGQIALAGRLRRDADTISAATDRHGAEQSKDIKDTQTQFAWDRRIFDERRQALTYVCETPVLLEQRVFEITRKIQERL